MSGPARDLQRLQDADGCPDHGATALVGNILVILQPINFEYNRAVIRADSFAILDEVAATLQGNPDLALTEVQGHSDERGDDAYNLALSDRRAAAVVTYLVSHGVATGRLTSKGYGESQPLDKHHTEQAWAKNRRVEFHILEHAR